MQNRLSICRLKRMQLHFEILQQNVKRNRASISRFRFSVFKVLLYFNICFNFICNFINPTQQTKTSRITQVSFYEEKSYNVTRPYMLEYSFYMGGYYEQNKAEPIVAILGSAFNMYPIYLFTILFKIQYKELFLSFAS